MIPLLAIFAVFANAQYYGNYQYQPNQYGYQSNNGNGVESAINLKSIHLYAKSNPLNYFYCSDDTKNTENTGAYRYHGPIFQMMTLNPNNDNRWAPVYRYYNGQTRIHFYTTNAAEIGTTTLGQAGKHGYTFEGVLGYILTQQDPGTFPVNRYNLPNDNSAHYYCLDYDNQCSSAKNNPGKFTFEGVLGYAYPVGSSPYVANPNTNAYGANTYGGWY